MFRYTKGEIKAPKYQVIVKGIGIKLAQQNQLKIQKHLFQAVGNVKYVNIVKGDNLFIEVDTKTQFNTLLNTTHLGEWDVKVEELNSNIKSIGCIYNVATEFTGQEILQALENQRVYNVDRMTTFDKSTKQRVITKTVKIHFTTPELPNSVILGISTFKVKQFIPKPIQCFKCQGYGHMANECKNEATCRVCGQNHNSRDCTEKTPKCVNCQGEHRSDDKSCPKKS